MKKDKPLQQEPKGFVYVPGDTVINVGNNSMASPKTKYENRRWECCRDAVKKVIGGILGNKNE